AHDRAAAHPVIEYEGDVVATARRQWARGGLLVGIVAVMAIVGIVLLIYLEQHIGKTALVVGVVAAFIPVPVLVFCFLWLDRYEPEPIKYLAFCLAWGATCGAAAALVLNQTAVKLLHLPVGFVAVVTAPPVEETMKAFGPFLLFLIRPR